MKKFFKIMICASLALFLFSGCSVFSTTKSVESLSPAVVEAQTNDELVLEKLLAATELSQKNLDMLRRLKQGNGTWPSEITSASPPPASDLNKKISLTWHGPVEGIAHAILATTDYKVDVIGNGPPQPIMVSMNVIDEHIYKIIEDIGWQTGDNVALVRDDRERKLKIIYKGDN